MTNHEPSQRRNLNPDTEFLAAVETIIAACGECVRDLLMHGHPRLGPEVVRSLARCAPERQRFELDQVRAGRRPFSTKSTVFDTTGYGEVVIAILARMDAANSRPVDFYLLPVMDLRSARLTLCETNGAHLDTFQFDSLDYFASLAKRRKVQVAA